MSARARLPLARGFASIDTFVREHSEACSTALDRYFSSFTGRHFEHFSALSGPLHLDANDIAACGALSVPLSGKAIDGLMRNAERITELLSGCPDREQALWEVDPAGSEYKALEDLYGIVREVPGIGYVMASKLLACKRPHLVPIRDTVVEGLLGTPDHWWAPWRAALTPELVEATQLLGGDALGHVSVLRKLDVILWMYGTHQKPLDAVAV